LYLSLVVHVDCH